MRPGDRALQWQAASPEELVIERWDGAAVLFHLPSCKTHFVNSATIDLLTRVLVTPRTNEVAAKELAALSGVECDPQFIQDVADLLPRLDELGLVRRVTAA